MNGETGRVSRVVVGISRSRASWWALAWAVEEARRRGARLLLVHVFSPPVAPTAADYRQGGFGTSRDLYADRMAHGNALILTAIGQAVGRMPGDVAMEQQVISGRPTAELAASPGSATCSYSDPGTGDGCVGSRPARWRVPARAARCPVVIVPEPSPTALPASLPTDLVRGYRFRWVPHRGEQTAS